MEERFLYSSIKPLEVKEDQKTIDQCFREEIQKADQLEISVGFSSFASLKELDRLVTQQNIKNVFVILGMYFFNGFPKLLHQLALEINKRWQEAGIGEIRVIRSFRYHGKLYCFMKDQQAFSAILGSANLSFLMPDETTRLHQYEVALFTNSQETLKSSLSHISDLKVKEISENIQVLQDLKLLFDVNPHVAEFKGVTGVDEKTVTDLEQAKSIREFTIPLFVPSEQDKHLVNGLNLSGSDLNSCYNPSSANSKAKNWFDLQLTIKQDLPSSKKKTTKKDWFYVVTDDGHEFKAQFSGQGGKQFSSFENSQILGRWVKGRLASLDLVKHIEDVSKDQKREGVITKEILDNYGGNHLVLKSTKKTKKDEKGAARSIWFLSFPRKII